MSSVATVNDLLQDAHDEGSLSKVSLGILTGIDIGQDIMNGMGISVDDVESSESLLLGLMPDDSGSIRMSGNSGFLKEGCNTVIRELQKTKQSDSILAINRYLSGILLYDFRPIVQAILMDEKNYNPNKGTPLYDQSVRFLGTMLTKHGELKQNGIPCRTISLIVSDGADLHSQEMTPGKVKSIVDDMLAQEGEHIIAGMGINDSRTDFRRVFTEMGILPEWILTPKSSRDEILAAFACFSQSSQQAAGGAVSFSKASAAGLGGFGS